MRVVIAHSTIDFPQNDYIDKPFASARQPVGKVTKFLANRSRRGGLAMSARKHPRTG